MRSYGENTVLRKPTIPLREVSLLHSGASAISAHRIHVPGICRTGRLVRRFSNLRRLECPKHKIMHLTEKKPSIFSYVSLQAAGAAKS